MKPCARFDEILIAGYFLNGLSILDVKFANLAPLRETYMDGMIGDPPFYFGPDFQRQEYLMQSFVEFLLWGMF